MDKVHEIINNFSVFEQVEGITIGGSLANQNADIFSDTDLCVFINKPIPIDERRKIAAIYADYFEIDNQFFGPGDEWKLRDSGAETDIMYLDMQWIRDYLESVVVRFEARVAYTTCFWHNVINSGIVYDKTGIITQIQKKYNIKYPNELKVNIIAKNFPILRKNLSSYYHQIEKALKRNDLISINHRVSAFLASYFDIIFAVNEIPHPGEKKLMHIIKNKCSKLPDNVENNINSIINKSGNVDFALLDELNLLVDLLEALLNKEHLL
jgi:predicted nucleotidyltransferase